MKDIKTVYKKEKGRNLISARNSPVKTIKPILNVFPSIQFAILGYSSEHKKQICIYIFKKYNTFEEIKLLWIGKKKI